MKIKNKTRYITISAVFAALICAAGMIHIPAPSQGGYVHAGDGIIYLAAAFLPLPYSLCAAAVGGALTDVIFGYINWLPFTVIIKMLNTLPIYFIKKISKKEKFITVSLIISTVISGVITCLGYYIAGAVIYGSFAASAIDLPGSAIQALASIIIYTVSGSALDSTKIIIKG